MTYQTGDTVLTLEEQTIGINGGQWHVPIDTEGEVISGDDSQITVRFTLEGESVDLPVMPMRVKISDKAARDADLAEVASTKAAAALQQITADEAVRQTDETAVDSDITGLTAQTAVATLGRMLAREKKALNREARMLARQKVMIRAIIRLVEKLLS